MTDPLLRRPALRITDIKTFLMQAQFPPEEAYATAHRVDAAKGQSGRSATRNWLFRKVYTDAGITGVGECSGWPRVWSARCRI